MTQKDLQQQIQYRLIEELTSSNKKYQGLVENLREVVFECNKDGELSYVNSIWYDLICDRAEEQSLQPVYSYLQITNEEWATLTERVPEQNSPINETPISQTFAVISRENQKLWLELSLWEKSDSKLVGLLYNITNIEQSKIFLQEANRRIRLLLGSVSEGIYGVDLDHRCTFINSAATNMLGLNEEDVIGKKIDKHIFHFPEEELHRSVELHPAIYSTTFHSSLVVNNGKMRRKDGSFFDVEYSSNPIMEDDQGHGAVVVFKDISETQNLKRKNKFLAAYDPLTGLLNRYEFEAKLSRAIVACHDTNQQHLLCCVDIDQFKIVNDTCGHEIGDMLLREIGELVQKFVRPNDSIARLGGDEFAILFDNIDELQAENLLNRFMKVIQNHKFTWKNNSFPTRASMGGVIIDMNTVSVTDAMSNADATCFIAKENGRNQYYLQRPEDSKLKNRRTEMSWVSRINHALENDRFILRFQKITPLKSSNQCDHYFEVLVSMLDDDDNLVPPGLFIPAAERYDLMQDIDQWVVSHTLAFLSGDQMNHQDFDWCSINLSGQSMSDPGTLQFIIDQLDTHRLTAEKICFEITETSAVSNIELTTQLINALKRFGCRFALDDFGSGMSSFNYLKSLPVDVLKIDGSLVRSIDTDHIDFVMLESIAHIAQEMGLITIAEFIENEEIVKCLQSIQIDYGQGFFFHKPELLRDISFEDPTQYLQAGGRK